MSQKELKYFDKRVSKRWIEKGRISKDDYQSHISNLTDMTGQYEDISEIVYALDEVEEEQATSTEAAAPAMAQPAAAEPAAAQPVVAEAAVMKTPSILPADDQVM